MAYANRTRRHDRPLLVYRPGLQVFGGSFPGTRYQTTAAGLVAPVAAGLPRDGHHVRHPLTGLWERTLFLEGRRTNAWTFPNDLANSAWSKLGCNSPTPNAALGPDGALSLWKLVEDTTNGGHRLDRALAGTTDNTVQSFAFHARAGERTQLTLRALTKSGAVLTGPVIDLAAGTVGAGPIAVRLLARGGGLYRCECSFNVGAGASTPRAYIHLTSGSISYPGDGASGAYLGWMQFEVDAPFASSEIPTGGATRDLEVMSLGFAAPPGETTLYKRFFEMGTGFTASGHLLSATSAGGGSPRFALASNGSGDGRYSFRHRNASLSTIAAATPLGHEMWSLVELLAYLYPDGSVQAAKRVNGGAVSASPRSLPNALGPAWAGLTLWLNGLGNNGDAWWDAGSVALTHLLVDKGLRGFDTMCARAGVA